MEKAGNVAEGLASELKRGTVVLAVLSRMKRPQYGYSLVQALEEKGFPVDPGTLYPLLRRLENQGLLLSEWETEGNRPRKYYAISETGKTVYRLLCSEWDSMAQALTDMINEEESNEN